MSHTCAHSPQQVHAFCAVNSTAKNGIKQAPPHGDADQEHRCLGSAPIVHVQWVQGHSTARHLIFPSAVGTPNSAVNAQRGQCGETQRNLSSALA